MNRLIRIWFFLFSFSFLNFCWAWGPLGHKTAAQVAWLYLSPKNKQAVSQLLKGQTLPSVSVWADGARNQAEWKHTTWFHFEKVYDNQKYLDNLKKMGPDYWKLGGPIQALYLAEEQMKDPKSNLLEKENAIKFAVHFAADLHQPLHTGRVEDNGGNKIKVNWGGMSVNLHQIWDSLIIYEAHHDLLNGLDEEKQVQAYTKYLIDTYQKPEAVPSPEKPYDSWVAEVMETRGLAYEYIQDSEAQYAGRFSNIVDQRIFKAGVRLAEMLTRMVENQPTTDPLKLLRKQIVSIVGEFSQFLSLKPKATVSQQEIYHQ